MGDRGDSYGRPELVRRATHSELRNVLTILI
jgi:hypothetical protein